MSFRVDSSGAERNSAVPSIEWPKIEDYRASRTILIESRPIEARQKMSVAPAPGLAPSPAPQLESAATWLNIGPASPMFAYEPQRNDPASGWVQDQQGWSSCTPAASTKYAVGIDALYCELATSPSDADHGPEIYLYLVSDITFLWTASSDCTVSVGFDGQLHSGPASTGSVTLNAQPGVHALRLEAVSSGGGESNFQFLGIKVNTAGGPSGYVLH